MLLTLISSACAAVAEYTWSIDWVTSVNPDGLQARRAIGVNGKWPIQPVHVNKGDLLVINVENKLNETTSLHFHGLFQNGTNYYDGALGLTECGIPPGGKFTYKVPIEQVGSYWIHGHNFGQYPDGLRVPLILHGLDETKLLGYDDEYVVGLSDWYHEEYQVVWDSFFVQDNTDGIEPIPNSPIINDTPKNRFNFLPGKTYRLRFVSMATFGRMNVWIDDHVMTIVEVDGVTTAPYDVDILPIATAQRYSVLVKAKNSTAKNYKLHVDFDESMFGGDKPAKYKSSVTANIVYAPYAPFFASKGPPDAGMFDEISLQPRQPVPAMKADLTFRYDIIFNMFTDWKPHGTFNNSVFMFPLVPPIFTALSMGEAANNKSAYGPWTHTNVLPHNKVIQMVLISHDREGNHPFHLHGHLFQVVGIGKAGGLNLQDMEPKFDALANPLTRDTVVVPARGWVVIRFRADNPGIWAFHCHIQWHLNAGLLAQVVEAPDVMQQRLKVPQEVYDQCSKQGIKTAGNAAGFNDLETFTGLTPSPHYMIN